MSLISAALLVSSSLAQTGDLEIQLVDEQGQPRRTSGIVVFLTDAEGSPAAKTVINGLSERPSPFLHSFYLLGIDQFVSETTGVDGTASFQNLKPGKYRVIAQKWDGVDGHPQHPKGFTSANRWRIIPNNVTAFGVGTAEVQADETTAIEVSPVGTSELAITVKRSHRGNFIFVSTGKPLIMPEYAPLILNRHLDRDVLLVQHISQNDDDVILRGLPADRDLTVALMAYDNIPGLGGIITRAGPGARREIKVHARWSDADPLPEPPQVKPLVGFIESNRDSIDLIEVLDVGKREDFLRVPGRDHINFMKVYAASSKAPTKTISVDGFGETTVAEFLVAWGIVEQRHREVAQQQKKQKVKPQPQPDDVQ